MMTCDVETQAMLARYLAAHGRAEALAEVASHISLQETEAYEVAHRLADEAMVQREAAIRALAAAPASSPAQLALKTAIVLHGQALGTTGAEDDLTRSLVADLVRLLPLLPEDHRDPIALAAEYPQ